MRPREADECLSFLAAHGFRFVIESRDIIAHKSPELPTSLVSPQRRSA
jgi:hypothetical protein